MNQIKKKIEKVLPTKVGVRVKVTPQLEVSAEWERAQRRAERRRERRLELMLLPAGVRDAERRPWMPASSYGSRHHPSLGKRAS
jgi:hypothetical protein